jgi:hypothetical protein
LLLVLAPGPAVAASSHADPPTLWEIILSWFAEDQARIHVPIG